MPSMSSSVIAPSYMLIDGPATNPLTSSDESMSFREKLALVTPTLREDCLQRRQQHPQQKTCPHPGKEHQRHPDSGFAVNLRNKICGANVDRHSR